MNSLTQEVESLEKDNASKIENIKKDSEYKISQIREQNDGIQARLNVTIAQLSEKIKQQSEENAKLFLIQNELRDEINFLRAEKQSLNATIEKQSNALKNESIIFSRKLSNLEQKLQDYHTENQLIKEENYNYCTKLFNLEQKIQNMTSENLDLKRTQTDLGFQTDHMGKKMETLCNEKQKLVAELECIKNHPVVMELEHTKQQNNVLRNVILEQKRIIIKLNTEKDENQKTLISTETQTWNHVSVQTDKKSKEIKKHNCIQRNIDAVTNPKPCDNTDINEAEKRIQDLENIVFILKHTLIQNATSNIDAHCLDK